MTLSTYPISNGLPTFNLGPSFLEYAIQREMKMASIKESLIAAKALIDTPEKWIKGESRLGDCFCALGAVGAVSGPGTDPGIWDGCHEALARAVPDGGLFVARFNDDPSTTHADMMALFDRAIAAQDEVA